MTGFLKKVEEAFLNLRPFFEEMLFSGTDCYRLFCGEADGIDGLVVERYADFAVIQRHVGRCALDISALRAVAEWYVRSVPLRAIYLKEFVADRSHQTPDPSLYSPEPFVGEVIPAKVLARENGLFFWIHPYEGFSTGLFLDQRQNRHFLGTLVARGRVLNTFSYTCAFSVAAASGGATTVSVDISKRFLEWGKENFEANGLALTPHQFFAMDAFDYLIRARKRGERFDLVIIDPPSFSRTRKGKIFSLVRDLKGLTAQACGVVAPGGYLFVSSNYAGWTSAHLTAVVERSLEGKWTLERLPPLADDVRRQGNLLSHCLLKKIGD